MQGKKLFHLSDWLNKRSLIKGKMWKRRRSGGKWDGEKERITRMELRRKGGRRGVTQSSKTKAAALTISILLSRRVSPPRSISSPGKALANVRDTRVPGWPIRIQSVHGRTIHGGCTGWFEKLEKPYFFFFRTIRMDYRSISILEKEVYRGVWKFCWNIRFDTSVFFSSLFGSK